MIRCVGVKLLTFVTTGNKCLEGPPPHSQEFYRYLCRKEHGGDPLGEGRIWEILFRGVKIVLILFAENSTSDL